MTKVRLRPRTRYRWLLTRPAKTQPRLTPGAALRAYVVSLIATAACSLIAWALAPWMALDSLVMVYLVGVVVVAARYGRGPSIVAAVASSVAFDYFFTLPFFSLRITEPRLVITVGVMLLVGLVISELTTALREQGRAAVEHARRVAVLYSLTRDLSRATDVRHIYQAVRRQVARAVGRDVVFLTPNESLRPTESDTPARVAPTLVEVGHEQSNVDPTSLQIAEWVFQHRHSAGTRTTHHPDAEALYLPLVAADRAFGVMLVPPRMSESHLTATQTRFLGHCARQVAGALERERLVRAAHVAERAAEEEQLRNSLLTSVSHDLRQPLMVIEAAASSLLEAPDEPVNPLYAERVRLLVDETRQISDTVNKILDMTRLESTPVQLDRRWYVLETLVLGALNRVRGCLSQHVVVPTLPNDLLWVYVDALVFEKLLTNLLENAGKYSGAATRIGISAGCSENAIEIRVTDEGCGLPPGDTDAVFRKFYRGRHPSQVPGIGLGLSICRAIVVLHGGSITAHRRPTGGTAFVISLPIAPGAPGAQPDIEMAEASVAACNTLSPPPHIKVTKSIPATAN